MSPPRGAVVRAAAQGSVDPCFADSNSHCGTLVPVLRTRLCKPRSRVAVGVARKRTSLLKAVSVKHRSKFAALPPVMVTAAR
jgi:hypothetical protein